MKNLSVLRLKRRTRVVLNAICLVLILSSCSKKNSKNLPVLHFDLSLGSNYSPILNIAANGGIAEKNGVYPILEYSNSIASLLAGKVDGRLNGLPEMLVSAAEGSDIVIFAGTMAGGVKIYSRKNDCELLKNPKNWKGKKIGVRMSSTSEMIFNISLKEKYGLKSDDFSFKYYEDEEAILGACKKGEVDIGSVYYSFRELAEGQGLVEIAELVDFYPDYACCRQTAYGPKLREDRESYVKWTKGLIESWKFFNFNKKDTIKLIKKVTNQDEQWVYEHIYDADGTAHITFNPDPFYNGCAPQYDVCVEKGYIADKKNARPISEFFDISIYADALRQVISENPDDQFYKDMWTYFVEHNNNYPDFEKNYGGKI